MGSRIPERWLDYNAINEPIEGAPIIAFKTPLSDRYNRPEDNTDEEATFVEKDKEFTPSQLVAKVEEKDLELSVVVDITFTFRYYNGVHEFENKHNIQYDKIKCPGQQIPPDEIINRFATIMNDFISENGLDGKKLVGLHCTHGVNRSGYVLARYLIEWLNFEPEKAIEAVGKARGYPIERENYLQDLKERKARNGYKEYNETRPSAFNARETIDLSIQWDEWIHKFEEFANKLQYTGARKKQSLFRFAGKDLQEIYQSIDHSGEDYDSILTDLFLYFHGDNFSTNVSYHRLFIFRRTLIRAGEGFAEYVDRLRTIADKCSFVNTDVEIVNHVIDKYASDALRNVLLRQPELTLETMIESVSQNNHLQKEMNRKELATEENVKKPEDKKKKSKKKNKPKTVTNSSTRDKDKDISKTKLTKSKDKKLVSKPSKRQKRKPFSYFFWLNNAFIFVALGFLSKR